MGVAWLLTAAVAATPPAVDAEVPSDAEDATLVDETEVVDVATPRRVAAPCRTVLTREHMGAFPAQRPDTYATAAPGMVVGTHLGRSAPQDWSWRGFDAKHGRDLQVEVDGVPLNTPGHAAGDGTVDLSFLPRIVVDAVDACPGAMHPTAGPWATAGSLSFALGAEKEAWTLRLDSGTDGSGQLTGIWRPKGWSPRTFVVVDAEDGAGVGQDRAWRDLRVMAGVEGDLGELHTVAWLALHDGASDVHPRLRETDVLEGDVPFQGGYRIWAGLQRSQRLLAALHLSKPYAWGGFRLTGWFGLDTYGLVDNTSGFLRDAQDGDGVETWQDGLTTGLRGDVDARWRVGQTILRLGAGGTLRTWSHRVRTWGHRFSGETLEPGLDERRNHLDVGVWVHGRLEVWDVVHVAPGVRLDHVQVSRGDEGDVEAPTAEQGSATMVSPKGTVSVLPGAGVAVHASYARSYRPPAPERLQDLGPDPVVFDGGEAQVRWDPLQIPVDLAITAHGTWSTNEPVLDLLDDRLLVRGATSRIGGTFSVGVRPIPTVRVHADASFTDARVDGEPIPYAHRTRLELGLHTDRQPIGPIHLTGGARFVWSLPRALPLGFVSEHVAWLDLTAAVEWRRWSFRLGFDNLAPWNWRQAEFVYASHWSQTTRPDPLPERHLVAGRPFAVRLGVGVTFP